MSSGTWRRWTGSSWAPPRPTGAGAFDPTTLGAVLWARAAGQAAVDGDGVQTWTADTGPDLVAPGTSPVYRPTGLDGMPGVEFTPGRWLATQHPALDLGEEFTVAVVLKTLPSNGDGMAWMLGQEATQRRRALWCSGTSQVNFSGYDSNVTSGATTSARCLLVVRRRAGVVLLRKNGATAGSGSPALTPYAYGGFGLGANVSGSEPYVGIVGAIAAFAKALTDAELATLEAGLMEDYAIG